MNNIQTTNSSMVIGTRVWVNGEELPPTPTKRKSHSVTQIDSKVYVDGYEFIDGKWKRTLKALWYMWF